MEHIKQPEKTTQVPPENTPKRKKLSFVDGYVDYHCMRTISPVSFAKHLAIQLLGHSMGRNSICAIQPRAIHMNTYLGLNGPSGKGKKTTAQNDVQSYLIPYDYKGYASYSPEGLMRALSETPNTIAPLGEFSTTLRSIKHNGNMSNFKEITNDLWECPPDYKKKLTNELYELDEPYLSMSTTCTEEEFYKNIDGPMVHGGFLPRWLFSYGTSNHKKRTKLPDNIGVVEELFNKIVETSYQYFIANPVRFELTEEAEDYFDKICLEWEDNEEWDNVQPFVARYESYIIKYACILKISDIIGKAYLTDITNITKKTKITNITEIIKKVKLGVLVKSVILALENGVIPINPTDIKRGYELIKPCLTYSRQIVQYVDEDVYVVKLKRVIDRFNLPLKRSKAMTFSKLTRTQMNIAVETLVDREELFEVPISYQKQGTKVLRIFCERKCTDCKYRDVCNYGVIK